MSSNFVIPPKPRRVLIHVYDHDSPGPRYHDIPDLQLRLRLCQTTKLRSIAEGLAKKSKRRPGEAWAVGKIVDRHGDEFVDPAETVWGALGLMPICIIKAAPSVEEEAKPPAASRTLGVEHLSKHSKPTEASLTSSTRAVVRSSSSSAWKATPWNDSDDRILLAARAAGEIFSKIQARHFPSRTAGSCQKRFQRLMSHIEAAKPANIRGAEPSPQKMSAPPVLSPRIADNIGKTELSSPLDPIDESDDEPLLLPVPKATSPPDAARIAATHSIMNRKALEQHHRRKHRREAAENRQNMLLPYGLVEKIKVEPEQEEKETRSRGLEHSDPNERAKNEGQGSPRELAARHPDQTSILSTPQKSPRHAAAPDPSQKAVQVQEVLPPPTLDQRDTLRHANRKPSSLTLIKVRGKRRDKPTERTTPVSTTQLERFRRQQERDYEASVDANLRRAREEAERQTSATRLERAERFMKSLFPTTTTGLRSEQRSSSPVGMDSSPSVRAASSRRGGGSGRQEVSLLSLASGGAMAGCEDGEETPSSPPVLGGLGTVQRRGPVPRPISPLANLNSHLPGIQAHCSIRRATSLASPKQQSRQWGTGGHVIRRPLRSREGFWLLRVPLASGSSGQESKKLSQAVRGRALIHEFDDTVSQAYDAKNKAARRANSRKPGF
ncbi:hypothetical protein NKR19_g8438 [Coniochaeta hoffmannii]|uniref:Myb-like domain-containing protein n=1 Tax=Coniochaeta hoffmannii TaxID=91930 RepID=A0AA38RGW6_9PEZI|nr:hypothetical protein NKR19_g8438 [Coniochaeta hoffmannii]